MKAKDKDPTTTLTIRNKAVSEVNKRFSAFAKKLKFFIVDLDSFGLGVKTNASLGIQYQDYGKFTYLREADKIQAFNNWLADNIELEILMRSAAGEIRAHWLSYYLGVSYEKGVNTTRRDVANATPVPGLAPGSVWTNPAHSIRAELIYIRAYDALENITKAMSDAISRELATAMIQGYGVDKAARNMLGRVEAIGKVRARLIARTEMVNAHNVASIIESQTLEGLIGRELKMQWHTSLDGRERDSHRERHGKIYTKEQALSLIGEPGCRCSISAYIEKPSERRKKA
jgi:hypothetical protein